MNRPDREPTDDQAHRHGALRILRRHEVSADALSIGAVSTGSDGLVTLRSSIGATRVVDLLTGEQLPRIC